MRSVILGGGIVGVATAYYLAKAGRQVTVIDPATQSVNDYLRAHAIVQFTAL